MLTTHQNLVASLRMSGAITLLPLYAFMALKRTTIPLLIVVQPVKKHASFLEPYF
jgi:hypothetical protein